MRTKRQLQLVILAMAVVTLLAGCKGKYENEQGLSGDMVRKLNHQVLDAANASPDSAMQMIDSLRINGILPEYRCDFLRAKIYSQSSDSLWLDSAIVVGERLMELDVMNDAPAFKQDVLEMLVSACRQHGDNEQNIYWCTQLIDLCRQNGDETEALRNEAEMGLMLTEIGHTEEGLSKIDSVINVLSRKRKFNEMDASIIALKRKENVLDNEKRYSDIPPVAQAMLDLLADYNLHPDEFHDNSYREVTEEQRPGYIDFYRSKAYLYMAYSYAMLNEKDKARKYLALYEQCDFAKTLEGRVEIAPTWRVLGEYEKMSSAYSEFETRLRAQGDTMNAAFADILRDRAYAAKAQGRYAESLRLYEQYESVNETLNDRLLRSKAHLYAARFRHQEQQREIEREQAANVRKSFYIGGLLFFALVIAGFAAVLYRQKRKLHRKNTILIEQISEAVDYKKKYEELKFSAAISQPKPSNEVPHDASDLSSLSDAELFIFLHDIIIREQLYLDPAFERQKLVDRFKISQHRIGNAFSQGGPYNSLPDFIRSQRLEYACQLLREKPDLSISEVAAASGFANHSTFGRDFKKKFDITPSDYRAQMPAIQ